MKWYLWNCIIIGEAFIKMVMSRTLVMSSRALHLVLTMVAFLSIWIMSGKVSLQSCPTLCDPMDYSMPGLPVHHQLPEFTQTHVHSVRDAIQPSHPLSSPSPPTFNLSQHQGLFKWISSSHQVGKVLELQLQHQSFQWDLLTSIFWTKLELKE